MAKVKVIHKKGKKPIKFHEGGLHESTSTPPGQKTPQSKLSAAMSGSLGPKAQKQVQFMHNILKK